MPNKWTIRFNLGRGDNFRKWKVVSPSGVIEHYDPNEHSLILNGCTLRNDPEKANKIFGGAHKTVCAWIECDSFTTTHMVPFLHEHNSNLLEYNPRNQPFWYDGYKNVDNGEYVLILSFTHKIYEVFDHEK